jgi:hypothetical protein
MTGCPNGCARPYQSDIGLVGRSGDKYVIYVGGNVLGDRLNFALRDLVPLAEIVPTLVPLLEQFKQQHQADEGFGDFCLRLGEQALQKLLPSLPTKPTPVADGKAASPAQLAPQLNGEAHAARPHLATAPTVPDPKAKQVSSAAIRSETFYAGPPGEELPDYSFRFNTDGSMRETIIYFYGNDLRAAGAHQGDALQREAVYKGRVDPLRLHAARKLVDTYYLGVPRQELRDRRVEYHPDGRIAHTDIFYYDGDIRAAHAPSGAGLRRQVSLEAERGQP